MARKDPETDPDAQPSAVAISPAVPETAASGSPAQPMAEVEARAALTHMLKSMQTPVALMELSLQLLATDQKGLCADKRAALRDALRAGRRIRQYFDHCVISEAGGHPALRSWRRRIDLGVVMNMLAEDYACDAADAGKSISVRVGSPAPSVRADEVALEHALQHALESTLHHLHGRRIQIEVRGGSVAEIDFRIDDPLCAPHLCELGQFARELDQCEIVVRALSGVLTRHELSASRTRFVLSIPSVAI